MILMATLAVCDVFGGVDVELPVMAVAAIYDLLIASEIGAGT